MSYAFQCDICKKFGKDFAFRCCFQDNEVHARQGIEKKDFAEEAFDVCTSCSSQVKQLFNCQ